MRLSVVIPTFNERGNLEPLLKRITFALIGLNLNPNPNSTPTPTPTPNSNPNYEVILVDDSSPDGTYAHALTLKKKYPFLRVFSRKAKRRDLSLSVLKAFKYARGDFIVVMDADLQHRPELIEEFYSLINQGYDMVIASRFLDPELSLNLMSLRRTIISSGAKFIANVIFKKLRRMSDPLSGFFIVRRSKLHTNKLWPRGYKILLELLVKLDLNYIEIPCRMDYRFRGSSKLGLSQYMDYILHLFRLVSYSYGQSKI